MNSQNTPESGITQRISTLLPRLPWLIPLMLLPLLIGWGWQTFAPVSFERRHEDLLFAYLLYIVLVRFALLDMMLFYVARSRRSMRLGLLHLVFLYLEVTTFTLLFFGLLYQQFGVLHLFAYNGPNDLEHMLNLQDHTFRVSMYISVGMLAKMGHSGWVPQTLNAMLASSIEALLGFVQSSVFFAVLIYAHQDKYRD